MNTRIVAWMIALLHVAAGSAAMPMPLDCLPAQPLALRVRIAQAGPATVEAWLQGGTSPPLSVRRAIDVHEGEKINEAAFKKLIRAAVALNTSKGR